MNKYTGVIGVYNCQGAAWNSAERKNTFHETQSGALTGVVRGRDVHLIADAATDPDWSGDCAIYCHKSSELITLPHNAALPVSLKVLEHEILTVTPIKVLAPGFTFAPFGLIDMFNAGGAIQELRYEVKGGAQSSDVEGGPLEGNGVAEQIMENRSSELVAVVHMDVKGCGRFGAYSSAKPRKCTVGQTDVDFTYNYSAGLVTLNLSHMPEEGQNVHIVEVEI